MPTIVTPTLIIQGRLDTVVEPANAAWLHQNLGAQEKALINLPRSDHLIALDRDRDLAIGATLRILARKPVQPRSSPVGIWLVTPPEAEENLPVGSASKVSELEQRIEQQFGLSRGILLAVGMGCLGLGGLAMALPLSLFGSFIRLVGVVLLGSGGFKAVQLLLGRRSPSARRRGWPVIVFQVAIDVMMGLLLLNHWRASVHVVTIVFGLLFLIEGIVLLYMALRAPTVYSRRAIVRQQPDHGGDRIGDRDRPCG